MEEITSLQMVSIHSTILRCIVLCCIVLYCVVLYCITLYCVVLYCVVLYCVVLCCIILCGIVLRRVESVLMTCVYISGSAESSQHILSAITMTTTSNEGVETAGMADGDSTESTYVIQGVCAILLTAPYLPSLLLSFLFSLVMPLLLSPLFLPLYLLPIHFHSSSFLSSLISFLPVSVTSAAWIEWNTYILSNE